MRRTGAVSVSGVMLLILACTISIFLVSNPVRAQQTADPLEGQTATIADDSIGPIAVAGCEAVAGEIASITVADADDAATRETFTDGTDTVFLFDAQGVTINGEEDSNLALGDLEEVPTGEVASSQGITCADGSRQQADDDNATDNDSDAAKTAEGLEDLGCEKLLVLFRGESGSGGQYADAAVFADSEVRARVEVCLEREIVAGTGIDEDLPDTGGPSLIALAVLGFVSAAAGLSVIRGGRR